ncbi:MAG: PD-(D/E)XK nuclease family protein [Bdellovibrionales bacterium]|nr:PD-(D/E)XK nuclease family protein [Bdellovibrionales bacterium]
MSFEKGRKPFGFYDIEKLRACILSGASSLLSYGKWLPQELQTRPIIVGKFYHDLMDLTFGMESSDPYEAMLAVLEKYRKIIMQDPNLKWMGDPCSWREINDAANSFLKGPLKVRLGQPETTKRIKNKLYSKSRLLIGSPDYLLVSDKKADLWEFKSSRIYTDGQLIQKHNRQVLYYAYLTYENFDVDIIHSRIIGLSGEESSLAITRELAKDFGAKCEELVKSALSLIDENRSKEAYANPGYPQCNECGVRAICYPFRSIQMNTAEFDGFRVISEKITKVENGIGGSFNIELNNDVRVAFPKTLNRSAPQYESMVGKKVLITYCKGSKSPFEASVRSQVIEVSNE